jgi:hypothetical protein
MSSQLSLSTRTWTPVASVNFFGIRQPLILIAFTNGDQRSKRRLAPSSGLKARSSAAAGRRHAGRAASRRRQGRPWS